MAGRLTLAFWVHTPHPFLIRFSENFGIRYYGLAYLAGFVGAGMLLNLYYRKGRSPFGANTIMDLMTYIVGGVVIGGRLGYFILYQPQTLVANPLVLFRVWEGGMASHGGFIGVTLAIWWWSKRRQVPLLQISDLVVTACPLGLMLGRLANFANGELWGKPTTVKWGMIFEQTGGGVVPRHPSQLYEAGLEGLLLFLYMQWRFWGDETARTQPGRLSGEFLIAYAFARSLGEMFREPDAGLILGLSRGTFYSLFMIVAGVGLIAYASRRKSSQGKA